MNFNKKLIVLAFLAGAGLTIATNADSSPCDSGTCGPSSINDANSNSQSTYNDQVLSPTVAQSATNVNQFFAGNMNSSFGGAQCNNKSVQIAAGVSNTEFGRGQTSRNYTIGGQFSMSLGESDDNCVEYQRIVINSAKIDYTIKKLDFCSNVVKMVVQSKVDYDLLMATFGEQIKLNDCDAIMVQASKGHHGQTYEQLAAEYTAYKASVMNQTANIYSK